LARCTNNFDNHTQKNVIRMNHCRSGNMSGERPSCSRSYEKPLSYSAKQSDLLEISKAVSNLSLDARGKMNEPRRAIDVKCRTATEEVDGLEIGTRVSGPDEIQSAAVDEPSLPSFFVVGPPRTGSSWLHEVLSPHALLPSPSKETRFFDTHFNRGLKWYSDHYTKSAERQRMGEVAPTYFASAAARERIAQTAPEAKIVCVFRNPVDSNRVPVSIETCIRLDSVGF